MVGIGEGDDLCFDALHSVLESEPLSAAVGWSELSVDELMLTGYWLCSLALEATLPDSEVLVAEVGTERALASAATVAWAIAKRLNGSSRHASTFRPWMKQSPLAFAMLQLVEKCEALQLNSIMPQSHNTAAEQLGSTRRSHQSRIKQHDPLPKVMPPCLITAQHVVINNIYNNAMVQLDAPTTDQSQL